LFAVHFAGALSAPFFKQKSEFGGTVIDFGKKVYQSYIIFSVGVKK